MNLRVQSIPEQCETLAALCKASGDALRLNVLRALAKQNPCPETLTELNGFYDALRIGGFKDGIVRLATEMRDASV